MHEKTAGRSGEMRKFRIQGLDCPRCALEIETELRRIEGFGDAEVSFGTETIRIPADGLSAAEQLIARIEPALSLAEWSSGAPKAGVRGADEFKGPSNSMRPARMGLAAALTIGGMVFEERMHAMPSPILEYAVFLTAYLLVGGPVVFRALVNILRGRVLDELFLMSAATIGAVVIHELPEAVSVMFFYAVGEYVQDLAVGRSRRSIASLMDLRPESARIIDERGRASEVPPERVKVGAEVEVRPGERVPLDGEVISGTSLVDTSALTGESVPRSVSPGKGVLAGFVNDSATIRIRAAKPFAESSLSRIFELVEDAAARKAPTEKFISRFASVYTPVVVGIAVLAAFLPPLLLPGISLADSVYRALVVLVVSCPCALVISVPLGYFGGIGGASRRGILIKGANYVDALKDVAVVAADKTGTLTKGVFKVTRKAACDGFQPEDVLRLAAAAEAHSAHPIGASIRDAWRKYAGREGASGSAGAARAGEAAGREDSGEGASGSAGAARAGQVPGLPGIHAPDEVREEKGFGVIVQAGGRRIMAGSDRLMRREGIAFPDALNTPGKADESPDESARGKVDEKADEKADESPDEKADESARGKVDEKADEKAEERAEERPDEKAEEKAEESAHDNADESAGTRARGRAEEKAEEKNTLPADSAPGHAIGGTVVYVAVNRVCAGYLVIADELKDEAAAAVKNLRSAGVERVVMLTGDNEDAARAAADRLGLDGWYAGLLPEEKAAKVEEISAGLPRGKRLAFVGDGINDAPVLMRADVGFAMGALGSDAAIEAADVVLMDDRVDGIPSAIRIARHTRSVVVQNICVALIVKLIFAALGAAGLAAMWEAVIADMGVSVLAVLNASRTLRGAGIGGLKAEVRSRERARRIPSPFDPDNE